MKLQTKYRVEKEDHARFLRWFYYHSPNKWLNVLRKWGGPFIIVLGIVNLIVEYNPVFLAISLFGVYYVFKPYIMSRFVRYVPKEVEIEMQDDMVLFKDGKNKNSLNLKNYKHYRSDKFYIIELSRSERYFIPKYKLKEEFQTSFDKQFHEI